MIILVAGSDSWRVAQDVSRLRAHFLEKFDTTGMNITEGNQKEHANDLLTAVRSSPFLGDKRMIVVHNMEAEDTDLAFASELIANLAETSILLLLSRLPSSELAALEAAVQAIPGADVKTHYYDVSKQLAPADITQIAQHYGLRLSNAQITELSTVTGDVVSRTHTLFATLKDAVAGGVIDESTWRAFFPKKPESQAFDYVDALLSGNPLRAFAFCEDIIASGGELMPVWSMIYTQLRKSYALLLAGPDFSKAAADMGISLYEQNKIKRAISGDGKYVRAAFKTYGDLEKQGKKATFDLQRALRILTDMTLLS